MPSSSARTEALASSALTEVVAFSSSKDVMPMCFCNVTSGISTMQGMFSRVATYTSKMHQILVTYSESVTPSIAMNIFPTDLSFSPNISANEVVSLACLSSSKRYWLLQKKHHHMYNPLGLYSGFS